MEIKIYTILYHEDDPAKNTALKMIRLGLAQRVGRRKLKGSPLVLDPYSQVYLGPWMRDNASRYGIVVVDASWKRLDTNRFKGIKGIHVKLPPLLPANPINYGKPCILSSIEAVAGTLYIMSYYEQYEKLLGVYKWMNTFHLLNKELLEAYSNVKTPEEIINIVLEVWGTTNPCYQFLK